MTDRIVTTGIKGNTYKSLFRKQIIRVKPPAVGLAVAYVSVFGVNLVKKILDEGKVKEVRLVTDVNDYVTHPRALENAINFGWEVRLAERSSGTFHPKLYVGAESFGGPTGLKDPSLAVIGSPNISQNGFLKNGECVFLSVTPNSWRSAAIAWHDCWKAGVPVTESMLTTYELEFALRNRSRAPQDMATLGVVDRLPEQHDGKPKKGVSPPKREHKAISEEAASVARAGLESITGQRTLQVEFPKEAGLVLQRIFSKVTKEDEVDILCADGEFRTFKFRFYENNGMFRLNIPNSTPLVDWARKHRDGIAYVEYNELNDYFYAEILRPGDRVTNIVSRSFAFGTWGRTPTRLYGWY